MTNIAVNSPVGELEWIFIDGTGKEDLQGNMKFTASVVLTPEQAEPFIAMADAFWEENKPKGAKTPKTCGYYKHKVKDEEASKNEGETVYSETGNYVLQFKTNTSFPNGNDKVVKVFNSKGAEISLMGKKIGNGSRGRIGGAMGIYNVNKASQGVTLYLNSIQLTKFVEYAGVSFDAIEDEDGEEGFDGVDSDGMGGIEDTPEADRPRL